ncbi:NAD(P)-binding protein [Coniochaeta ligniaria NRRL 30616]|uniref:NAD(P)-binding protein n=1 Tax=Coniochaeta ligniaria NRRL 30616 TaxID=1408157 RepID=A0A1J7JZT9_9PEZI|nr:NAD(P)-binding protein [Coniochaeta ligniaria NRRL 30616]
MSRHFASEGHFVCIFDLNTEAGSKIAGQLSTEYPNATVTFRKCDVSSWEDQAAAFKEVYQKRGTIDIVMANAGISEQGSTTVVDLREEEPTAPRLGAINVNLIGVVYTVKLASHYMNRKTDTKDSSRGLIICTASNAGLYTFPVAPLYAASKFGVIGLVRALGKPLQRHGIQINALAPAVLETNIAPSKDLFKDMIITPMETLIRGVSQFVADPSLSGEIAEIHGSKVTLRPPHEHVDEDSAKNLEVFANLGYA